MTTGTCVVFLCIVVCSVAAEPADGFTVGSFDQNQSSRYSSSSSRSHSSASSSSINYNVRSQFEPFGTDAGRNTFVAPGTGPLGVRNNAQSGSFGSFGSLGQRYGSGNYGGSSVSFGSGFDDFGHRISGNSLSSSSSLGGSRGGVNSFGESSGFYGGSSIFGNTGGDVSRLNVDGLGGVGKEVGSRYELGSSNVGVKLSGTGLDSANSGSKYQSSGNRFGFTGTGGFGNSRLGGGNIVPSTGLLGSNTFSGGSSSVSGGGVSGSSDNRNVYNTRRYGTKENNFNYPKIGTSLGNSFTGFGSSNAGGGTYNGASSIAGIPKKVGGAYGSSGTFSSSANEGKFSGNIGSILGNNKVDSLSGIYDGSRRYGENFSTGFGGGNGGISSFSQSSGVPNRLTGGVGTFSSGNANIANGLNSGATNTFSGTGNTGIKGVTGNYQGFYGSSTGSSLTGLGGKGVNNLGGIGSGNYGNIIGNTGNLGGGKGLAQTSTSGGINSGIGTSTDFAGIRNSGTTFGFGGSTSNLETLKANSDFSGFGSGGSAYKGPISDNNIQHYKGRFGGSDSNVRISDSGSRLGSSGLTGSTFETGSTGSQSQGGSSNSQFYGVPSQTLHSGSKFAFSSSLNGVGSSSGPGSSTSQSGINSGKSGVSSTSFGNLGTSSFNGIQSNKATGISGYTNNKGLGISGNNIFGNSKSNLGTSGSSYNLGSTSGGTISGGTSGTNYNLGSASGGTGFGSGTKFGTKSQSGISTNSVINPTSNIGGSGSVSSYGSPFSGTPGTGTIIRGQGIELKSQGTLGNYGSSTGIYGGVRGISSSSGGSSSTGERSSNFGSGFGDGLSNTKLVSELSSGLYSSSIGSGSSGSSGGFGGIRGNGQVFGVDTSGSNSFSGPTNRNDGRYRVGLGFSGTGEKNNIFGVNENENKSPQSTGNHWDSAKRLGDFVGGTNIGGFSSTKGSSGFGSTLNSQGQTSLSTGAYGGSTNRFGSLKDGYNVATVGGVSGSKNAIGSNSDIYRGSTGNLAILGGPTGLGTGSNRFGGSSNAFNVNPVTGGGVNVPGNPLYGTSTSYINLAGGSSFQGNDLNKKTGKLGFNQYGSVGNRYGSGFSSERFGGSADSLGGSAGSSRNTFSGIGVSGYKDGTYGGSRIQDRLTTIKSDDSRNKLGGFLSSSSNIGSSGVNGVRNTLGSFSSGIKGDNIRFGGSPGSQGTSFSFGTNNAEVGFNKVGSVDGTGISKFGSGIRSQSGPSIGSFSGSSSLINSGDSAGGKGVQANFGRQGISTYDSRTGSGSTVTGFVTGKGTSEIDNIGGGFGTTTKQSNINLGNSGGIDSGTGNKGFGYFGISNKPTGSSGSENILGFSGGAYGRDEFSLGKGSSHIGGGPVRHQDCFSRVTDRYGSSIGSTFNGRGSGSTSLGSLSGTNNGVTRLVGSVPGGFNSDIGTRGDSKAYTLSNGGSFHGSLSSGGTLSGASGFGGAFGTAGQSAAYGGAERYGNGFLQPGFGRLSATETLSSSNSASGSYASSTSASSTGLTGSGGTKSLHVAYGR